MLSDSVYFGSDGTEGIKRRCSVFSRDCKLMVTRKMNGSWPSSASIDKIKVLANFAVYNFYFVHFRLKFNAKSNNLIALGSK